jgi:hypothetical protein
MADVAISTPPGAKGITLVQFIQKIRKFMRDSPYLNRLTEGYESSDEDILEALEDAIDDFNQTPPFIGKFNLSNPPPWSILKRGVVICLLESVGLLTTRNSLPFSDGGIQVQTNKAPELISWLQIFRNIYEEKKIRYKTSVNIENAFGVGAVSSEYTLVNTQALIDSF